MLSRYPRLASSIATRCSSRFQSSSSSSTTKNFSKSSTVGEYFSALRWKAANALTNHLPDDERNLLLDKLSSNERTTGDGIKSDVVSSQSKVDKDEDDNSITQYQPSIDEAIAAAKLREAERYEQKWKTDKEALIAEAEKAARSRIESDIEIQKRQIAFEAWKRDLEVEKNESIGNTTTAEQTAQEKEILLGEHPILGKCISELSYKRIHLASLKNLAAIPVWEKQRIFRHERSKKMATDKMKTLHLGLPGIIGIFENIDGSLNVIDGQHRVGMLKVLETKVTSNDFDFDNILVEVYPALKDEHEETHANDLFLEVNKAEPVKTLDLPGVAKAADKKIINEVADRLHDSFPEMFSDSQRCRPPHLNIDNLRETLFVSNIIRKHNFKTSKAVVDWILEQNDLLEVKFQEEENRQLVSPIALKKAEKFRFYLGLESRWLLRVNAD
ncbi:MAG: hypothetical protein ACI8RD_000146 [Bacillariaceae sp.]|jgi:hypothetical protein